MTTILTMYVLSVLTLILFVVASYDLEKTTTKLKELKFEYRNLSEKNDSLTKELNELFKEVCWYEESYYKVKEELNQLKRNT